MLQNLSLNSSSEGSHLEAMKTRSLHLRKDAQTFAFNVRKSQLTNRIAFFCINFPKHLYLSNNVADIQKNTEECLPHTKQQEKARGECLGRAPPHRNTQHCNLTKGLVSWSLTCRVLVWGNGWCFQSQWRVAFQPITNPIILKGTPLPPVQSSCN